MSTWRDPASSASHGVVQVVGEPPPFVILQIQQSGGETPIRLFALCGLFRHGVRMHGSGR
jgi:hypothetical protein